MKTADATCYKLQKLTDITCCLFSILSLLSNNYYLFDTVTLIKV